jgi:hypothetical protein
MERGVDRGSPGCILHLPTLTKENLMTNPLPHHASHSCGCASCADALNLKGVDPIKDAVYRPPTELESCDDCGRPLWDSTYGETCQCGEES